MTRSALHLRLFLTFALVALLSSLASALVVAVVTGRHAEDEAVIRLRAAGNAALALLELEKDRDLSDAAELAALLGRDTTLDPTRSQQVTMGSRQRIKDDYVAVMNVEGSLLAEDAATPGLASSASHAAKLALTGRPVVVADLRERSLRVEAAAPISQSGAVAGVVVAGDLVDSRFLERIKRTTGLEGALLGGDRVIASVVEQPGSEVEQRLASELQGNNAAERLAVGEQIVIRPQFRTNQYVGLLVPIDGGTGRAIAALFLGLPAGQLSSRQLELLIPLLGLLLATLVAISSVSFFMARMIAARLAGREEEQKLTEKLGRHLALDGLEIDRDRHEVSIHGQPVALTPTEFQLLWILAAAPGHVFSRQELMDRVWGTDFAAESGVIDTHIGNLRRKLEAAPGNPRYVVTVRGVGFKFRDQTPEAR